MLNVVQKCNKQQLIHWYSKSYYQEKKQKQKNTILEPWYRQKFLLLEVGLFFFFFLFLISVRAQDFNACSLPHIFCFPVSLRNLDLAFKILCVSTLTTLYLLSVFIWSNMQSSANTRYTHMFPLQYLLETFILNRKQLYKKFIEKLFMLAFPKHCSFNSSDLL